MSTRDSGASGFGQFVAEMKRRHVVRFAVGYAAAAFVVLQLAEIVLPAFEIGETGLRVVVLAVVLLFPPAVTLAWIYDITRTGIKRTEDLPSGSRRGQESLTPKVALLAVTVVAVGAAGVWLVQGGFLDEAPAAASDDGLGAPSLVAYNPGDPIRSLAVLPLDNFSETGEQDYFSAGMHEELIAQLSQIAGLRVVSRTSVMQYDSGNRLLPEIGRDLGVDGVIEGSIRRDGNQVRITVQLIHAPSDTHVWTEQYDGSLDDVFTLQSEVAMDIVSQVKAELSPEEATLLRRTASRDVDARAQEAYLRGRFEADKGTPEGLEAALDLFEEAVEVDSSFAPALASVAGTRFLIGMSGEEPSGAQVEQAHSEAMKAMMLDSLSMEAEDVLALIESSVPEMRAIRLGGAPRLPTPEAAGAAEQVVEELAAPGDTSWVTAVSNLGRRIEEQMRARSLAGTREGHASQARAARQLMVSGEFDEAVDLLEHVVDENPSSDMAWEALVRACVADGETDDAVEVVIEWSRAGTPGAPTADEASRLEAAVDEDGDTGYWEWRLTRLEARIADGMPVPPTEIAAAKAGTGDVDGAFEALMQAFQRRDPGLASLRTDPVWDALRSDHRFTALARRVRVMRKPSATGRR